MMGNLLLLAVELGDLQLNSGTSGRDMVWFFVGLCLLLGITAVVLYWHRSTEPDPFA